MEAKRAEIAKLAKQALTALDGPRVKMAGVKIARDKLAIMVATDLTAQTKKQTHN